MPIIGYQIRSRSPDPTVDGFGAFHSYMFHGYTIPKDPPTREPKDNNDPIELIRSDFEYPEVFFANHIDMVVSDNVKRRLEGVCAIETIELRQNRVLHLSQELRNNYEKTALFKSNPFAFYDERIYRLLPFKPLPAPPCKYFLLKARLAREVQEGDAGMSCPVLSMDGTAIRLDVQEREFESVGMFWYLGYVVTDSIYSALSPFLNAAFIVSRELLLTE